MFDTLSRYLLGIPGQPSRTALRFVLTPAIDRLSTQALTSSGLAINAAGAAFAKTGAAAFYATAGGKLVTLAPGTAMPALTGVAIPAGFFGVVCFFVDSGGVLTMAGGTPTASLAGALWPTFPLGKALVGALVITGVGAFIGGTTALDAATTVYLSPAGAFDPTALV